MINFGPSGFCEDFAAAGHKKSEEMPEWLESHGLSAYEISFTNGINMSDEKCVLLGKLFAEKNITLSVHGPYYINFANPDPTMIEKSIGYIINSLKKMKLLGAKRLVFHPGALMKQSREEAHARVMSNLKLLMERIDDQHFDFDFQICPETMGKHGQCGTVAEVAEMCSLDKRIVPTLDFGHINSFGQGSLVTEQDFANVFDTLKMYIGERYHDVHIHFTHIEYGPKGEVKHVLADNNPQNFGPDFEPLAKVLKDYEISGEIISESPGHQTRESVDMMKIYQNA
ncbi:MAG: TIM barrel protein [Clostridia bacterium]|nr:TIM barrel protein [Clostridia bacterium]